MGFQFTESFGDARVEELRLLTWADQHAEVSFSCIPTGPWHDLLFSLLSNGLLSTPFESAKKIWFDEIGQSADFVPSGGLPNESKFERCFHYAKLKAIRELLEMRCLTDHRLTHPGRVRLSQLRQELRTGREREPLGILWDGRHWEKDTQIAILDAQERSPLAMAYMDMNGLKQINDKHGHDAGDLALKSYFGAVESVLGDGGHAHRLSGGADEVILLIPNCDEKRAVTIVRVACDKLMEERLWSDDANDLLSISVGIAVTTDSRTMPTVLRSAADQNQKKAKEKSKKESPRPSVIACQDTDELIVLRHIANAV